MGQRVAKGVASCPVSQENLLGAAVEGIECRRQFGIHPVTRRARLFHGLDFSTSDQRFGGRRVLDILEQLINVAQEHQYVGANSAASAPATASALQLSGWASLSRATGLMTGVKPADHRASITSRLTIGACPTRPNGSPTDSERSSVASDPQSPTLASPASLSAATIRILTLLKAIST